MIALGRHPESTAHYQQSRPLGKGNLIFFTKRPYARRQPCLPQLDRSSHFPELPGKRDLSLPPRRDEEPRNSKAQTCCEDPLPDPIIVVQVHPICGTFESAGSVLGHARIC